MNTDRVTLQQIADRVGVSAQTVANVLQGRNRRVYRRTFARAESIRQVANELGYRPNVAARAVSTGRFGAVGLLMGYQAGHSTLFGELIQGAHDALEARRLHLSVNFVSDRRLSSDVELPKLLGEAMIDGLLLNYTHDEPQRMAELIDHFRIPSVWLNSKRPANCIYIDDAGAAADATARLLSLGHRRVSFLDSTRVSAFKTGRPHYSHDDRRLGYERVMRAAGLQPVVHTPSGWWNQHCFPRARDFLAAADRPTAVVCYSGMEASILVTGAAMLGLRPGPDLSLVCFETHQSPLGMPVDTWILPNRDLGGAAVQLLMEIVEDPSRRLAPRQVAMPHRPGATLCPPPDQIPSS